MNAPFSPPGTEGLPLRLFTNAEIRQMVEAGIFDEGERVELIRGVLSPMGSEGSLHARARWLLSRIFTLALGPEWFVASNTSLFLADDIEVQPDLHVFPASIPSADVKGRDVLLAIELSNTTQHRDLKIKTPIYAEHGVRELWVLDIDAKTGLIFDRIENGAYAPGRAVGLNDVLTPSLIARVSLRIADLF
jgi:Uma2 family endonuclease